MLIKKFSLNQLTIRTFTVFWLAFFAMTALLVALPYFDSRLYSDLNQNEISSYQKKLVESIRNNRITGILAGVPVLPTDKFDSARPVIMTPEKEIFGALGEERMHIAQFAQESSNFAQPQRKTFKDIQIAGPFKVYIGDAEQSSELFFVSRANGQQEILRYMLDHPWVLLLLTLIITTPLLWWFTHTIVKPITNLQKAANSVALGNFKVDNELANHGPEELREVGQSFNKMSIAIDNLISNQHNLLSSISHELKTPLTIIKGIATRVKSKPMSQDDVKLQLESIIEEVDRMTMMVQDTLNYMKMENPEDFLEYSSFNLKMLVEHLNKKVEHLMGEKHLHIHLDLDDVYVEADSEQIMTVVTNLYSNAIRYTPDGDHIYVTLKRYDDKVRFEIENTGIFIPEAEIDRIWEPFYRLEKSRNRDSGGTGLGLLITNKILKMHHSKYGVMNTNRGVKFYFNLNIDPDFDE